MPAQAPLPHTLDWNQTPLDRVHQFSLPDSFPTSHPTNSYSSLKTQVHRLLCEASLTSLSQSAGETTEA